MADNKDKNNDQTKIPFKVVPAQPQNIGVSDNDIIDMLGEDESLQKLIDSSILSTFRDIGDKREFQYRMYDEMAKDVLISSALDLYADDATEYADDGRVIWGESTDANVSKTVNEIISSLKLDESAWGHIRSLIEYGDLYLETFRFSDGDLLMGRTYLERNSDNKSLVEAVNAKQAKISEDVIVNAYGEADRLESYIEAAANPAEIFELVKRGKTVGYIKSKISQESGSTNFNTNYRFNYSDDVQIYDATKYVHCYLPNTSARTKESVQIFRDLPANSKRKLSDAKKQEALEFNVRRGRSILFDVFKVFRELKLLEDSVLLTRVTKSSIVRIIEVEVGEMGKTAVAQTLQRVKSLMENKPSMTEGGEMKEYASPSALENNIYVPTRGGKGHISAETLGGDYNPSDFPDLDYFLNKVCSGLKIPKPFLNFMDDNAGFSGGESLAKVSSRYAKTIKRIQNAYIQGIKTLVNIILLDRGMDAYVNNFDIKMQSPSTIEDSERIEMTSNKVQLIADIMNALSDLSDEKDRLKVLKSLLARYLGNEEVTQLLDEIIEKLESTSPDEANPDVDISMEDEMNMDMPMSEPADMPSSLSGPSSAPTNEPIPSNDEDQLPNPHDMDIDFTDNEQFANDTEDIE